MKNILLFFLWVITGAVSAQETGIGMVMSVASEKGNVIRYWPESEDSGEITRIWQTTRKFHVYRAKTGMNDLQYEPVGTVNFPRTNADFKHYLSEEDYSEWRRLLNLRMEDKEPLPERATDLETMVLFSELKAEFLLAYGLGFLDTDVAKGEFYQYQVVREDTDGKMYGWGETSLFAREGNLELERVAVKTDSVTASDSLVTFRWSVGIPDFTDIDFMAIEDSAKRTLRKLRTYKGNAAYQEALGVFNRYGLNVSNTSFLTYYRINEEEDWHYLEKNMAAADSLGTGHFITSSIPCLPHDRVEAVLIAHDFAGNRGRRSATARGWAVGRGSLELIRVVQARDSVNSIIISWDSLPPYSYYSGIEVAKSSHDMEKQIIAVLPPEATYYKDIRVFPAGTLYSYYVRPLFTGINGLEQEVASTVIHSCTTFSKPVIPYHLQVAEKDSLVKITWEGAEDEAFHSYHVLRGLHPDHLELISGNVFEKEFYDTVAHLSPKLTYYYSVMSMNLMQDTSQYAVPVSFNLAAKEPVNPPPFLEVQIVNGDAFLTWDHVKLNNTDITGYLVQKSEGGSYQSIHSGFLEGNFLVEKNIAAENTAYYRVASLSVRGDTSVFSPPTTLQGAVIKDENTPVTGITLADMENSVRISWPAVLSGSVTRFRVYRRLPQEPEFKLLKEISPGNFYYEDTDVKSGIVYVYSVAMVNAEDKESELYEEQTLFKE